MSLQKLAKAIISAHNFELGFAKAAQDAGLTHTEYEAVRKIAAERGIIDELTHPRMWEESPAGVLNAYGEGLLNGTEGFSRAPVNSWSSIGNHAQIAGMIPRAIANPPSAMIGVLTALLSNGIPIQKQKLQAPTK